MSRSELFPSAPRPGNEPGRTHRRAKLMRGPSIQHRLLVLVVAGILASALTFFATGFRAPQHTLIVAATVLTATASAYGLWCVHLRKRKHRKRASFRPAFFLGFVSGVSAIALADALPRLDRLPDTAPSPSVAVPSRLTESEAVAPLETKSEAKRHVALRVQPDHVGQANEPQVFDNGTKLLAMMRNSTEIVFVLETASKQFVSGLRKKDFTVRNASMSPIDFDLVEHPRQRVVQAVDVGFVIDAAIGNNERRVVLQLVSQLASSLPQGYFRVAAFGQRVDLLSTWTTDLASLQRAIIGMQYSRGGSIVTAVDVVADELRKRSGHRLLIVFDTGINSENAYYSAKLGQKLRLNDIQVLVAHLGPQSDESAFLARLAAATGGRQYGRHQSKDLAAFVRAQSSKSIRPHYTMSLMHPAEHVIFTAGAGLSKITRRLKIRR